MQGTKEEPGKGVRGRDEWPGLQDSGKGQGYWTGVKGRNEGQWCWGEGDGGGLRDMRQG